MPPSPRYFFGRRSARRLSLARMRLLDQWLPRLHPSPDVLASDVLTWFDVPVETLYLEIGSGTGEHALALLERDPCAAVLAIEPYTHGLGVMVHQACERRLIARLRAFPLAMQDVLPVLPRSVFQGIFVLFADPWPRKRHHKRRVLTLDTVPMLLRLLSPGGSVVSATDDPLWASDLLDLSEAVERLESGLVWSNRMNPDHPPEMIATTTRYAQKARTVGRPITYVEWQRKSARCDER